MLVKVLLKCSNTWIDRIVPNIDWQSYISTGSLHFILRIALFIMSYYNQPQPQYNQQPYQQQPPQYGAPNYHPQPVSWPPQQSANQPMPQQAYPMNQPINPAQGQSQSVPCRKCGTMYPLPAGSPSFRCKTCGEMNGTGFTDGLVCCFCTIL